MKNAWFRRLLLSSAGLTAMTMCLHAQAQTQSEQRWYQIEVTLFAHDNAMQAQEHWPLEALTEPLPRNTRTLDRITDVLSLPEWQASVTVPAVDVPVAAPVSGNRIAALPAVSALPEIALPLHDSDFRLPDPERDAFLALPVSAHGFTDTNRALTNSPDYRVLYHNAWRQPLTRANQATPIWIDGGQAFGGRHELEGTLTLRFNPGQDRVVLDARLWLTQFSSVPPATDEEIRLPARPQSIDRNSLQAATDIADTQITPVWYPAQVIPVINSREMRSNEFHYLDHPAVGIVVHVFPYEVPPLPAESAALL